MLPLAVGGEGLKQSAHTVMQQLSDSCGAFHLSSHSPEGIQLTHFSGYLTELIFGERNRRAYLAGLKDFM